MTVSVDWTQVDARPWHLTLERESDRWWTVTDQDDVVMMRSDRALCERFIHAFVEQTPGATCDRAGVEHSWRVAQDALSERGGAGRWTTESEPCASPRSENVFPIRMHEPVDEATAS